ncbi:MAG: prolipoprotein diacylglyceryl transferase [Marinifilaceae bacterium]
MSHLLYIDWNVDPTIFQIGGLSIMYYSLFFALAFLLGYKVEERMFKSEKLPIEWLDKLWIYVAVATVIGARLGHCIFYDWAYFSQHPLEIFLPVKFAPEFRFTGFRGLASHGAAIGIIVGLWIYSKRVSKKPILWILDRAIVPIALAGFFIRMGNLMNSEIIGSVTSLPWGFRFLRSGVLDPLTPRHPAQLYEAIFYLCSFCVLMYLYWRTNAKEKQGYLFGTFLILIFASRFLIEFVKENQEAFEDGMMLNMGQILSIPFVLAGIFFIYNANRKYRLASKTK